MARQKVPGAKKTSPPGSTPKSVAKAPAPPRVARDNIELLGDVELTLTAELGRTRETIGAVTELGKQSLIEFDKSVGDPVDILLNGTLFARGEVVTVGENFGLRVIEVVARRED